MVGKRILNYQIISLLGEGGMGSVYKAYDLQLERYVAIKIINPKLVKDPVSLERFRFEAKNQAKLNHPNIVAVYGFIETREATGFVMEYVDGSTISQLISTYGRLDLIYSLRVLQQVLIAIDYAHSMGFVHRDLKPSNIIIDRNGVAKIMDFGISKSLNENQNITRVGFNIGTIHYMSPEQIKGLEPTPQTDIYSLGITLYEMLAGSPPFNFNSDYEIYEAHLKMIPNKLSVTFPEIPNEVDDLILSALNKLNKKNFINAYEFRSSIEQLIFNLPLLVSRPSVNQSQTTSISQKKTRSANLIVAFIVLLTVLIIGVSYVLVEKFIIKEKINSSSENKSEVNYLVNENYFSAPWQEIKTNIPVNLNTIAFISSNLFVGGTRGSVLISKNNGQSFDKIKLNEKVDIHSSANISGKLLLTASDGKVILLDEKGKILQSIKLADENFLSSCIKDRIYICGSDGIILKSDKSKLKFEKINSPAKSTLYDIIELGNASFITCGWNGSVYKTTNDGLSFSENKLSQSYLKKLYFINQFLGFVGGADGNLFKSTDGGENWSKLNINTVATINDIIFVNQKTGFIVTSEGELFVSENSGEDWQKLSTGIRTSLNKIAVLNNGMIYLIGNNGIILKNKL
ncbi:Serine/threonine protein kinase [Ignavibacterium album JCM 16511]|uniref:non-specific serine/threonine protein kinase n=1 Tax=Ignavibacterium album (strain DSM 19864 / JCM 16511 / NBRC 101810 / Mat9-16) TaxID=945713 RepID=I0AKA5_IGNAJ|nr:serine/threonine-protein kinase [Ignavibacterium album]AFH49412.1 Serine/threonine protein kinase [Ignavibacterium album JCM 16511]